MTTIQVKRTTFKKMESEWYCYHETVREIANLREEIMNPQQEVDENTGGGRSGFISAPTERIATGLVANKKLRYLTEIVTAIEEVYNALPDDYKRLVRTRYWSKGNELNWDGVSMRCNISRRQAIVWRNQIIQATIELLGWR
jgi:RinA family phage transcriptional activator